MSWFQRHTDPPSEATVVVERVRPSPFWVGLGIAAGLVAAALITWAVVKPGQDSGDSAEIEGPIA